MKKGNYKSMVSKIRLSDEEKNNLKGLAQRECVSEKIVKFGNVKKAIIPTVAAVLVFALVGLFFVDGKGKSDAQKDNSLIITASAAEVSTKKEPDKLTKDNQIISYDNYVSITENAIQKGKNKTKNYHMGMNVTLDCKGKGIEYVTYKSNDFGFMLNYTENINVNRPVTDVNGNSIPDIFGYAGLTSFSYTPIYCDFFTVHYNNKESRQVSINLWKLMDIDNKKDIEVLNKYHSMFYECDENADKDDHLRKFMRLNGDYAVDNGLIDKSSKYYSDSDTKNLENTFNRFANIIKKAVSGSAIEVTVKFKDGTFQNFKIKFSYNNKEKVKNGTSIGYGIDDHTNCYFIKTSTYQKYCVETKLVPV